MTRNKTSFRPILPIKLMDMNGFMIILGLLTLFARPALAQTAVYPAVRYLSPYSQSLGGVSLPLSQDIGNSLFNNPAGLAHSEKFRAEFLNLDADVASPMFGAIGTGMTGLGGLSSNLNSHPNTTYAEGASNLTALSWGGLGVGILFQDRSRAYSDGTTVHYETLKQFIPAVGYGLSLARGVIRLGYSLQYINEASGIASSPSNSSASYLSGLNQGHGFSSTASVNFVFTFTYLPTFSLVGRNIGGLHYTSGSMLTGATNVAGLPSDENTSVDAAFNWTVRLSASMKSYWFVEYDDVTQTESLPVFEKLRFGVEVGLTQSFWLRAGTNGGQFAGGVGFKSESSEINVTMYRDRSEFTQNSYWDTRYALQYKVYFQAHNSRDRDAEAKGKQQQ